MVHGQLDYYLHYLSQMIKDDTRGLPVLVGDKQMICQRILLPSPSEPRSTEVCSDRACYCARIDEKLDG